jgi:release factor glutamine methyltransferase
MYTLYSAYYSLKDALMHLYDERESAAIAHEVLEFLTGFTKTERLMYKDDILTTQQLDDYNKIFKQLSDGVPLQYSIGQCWFMNHVFMVNSAVLIPRPETEELLQWIVNDYKSIQQTLSIFEIGTGSGCIAVSLAHLLSIASVTACDISSDALMVANYNAKNIGVDVKFECIDFLKWQEYEWNVEYNIIVSNPPYIPMSVKEKLHSNVIDHEPHLALFVPDNDPLVFYRTIATFALKHLVPDGTIYCELDTDNAIATQYLFKQHGYKSVTLKEDIHGNKRMLKAIK